VCLYSTVLRGLSTFSLSPYTTLFRSEEAGLVRRLPPLFTPPAPSAPRIEIPSELDESYPPECSTQEAFGRVLGTLSRLPGADRKIGRAHVGTPVTSGSRMPSST